MNNPMTDLSFPELAYGRQTKIGMIELATSVAFTVEARMAVPESVIPLFSRVELPRGEVSAEGLDQMVSSNALEETADKLTSASVEAIVFACTMGSLLHGHGFDVYLADRISKHAHTPVVTTATEVVRALRELGARTIAIGTPYIDELNQLERQFFEDAGFVVEAIQGLSIGDDREISCLDADKVRALARSSHRTEADALFLSCTNMPTLPILAELEVELGVPVVSSNAATLWGAIRTIQSSTRTLGLGALLDSLHSSPATDTKDQTVATNVAVGG